MEIEQILIEEELVGEGIYQSISRVASLILKPIIIIVFSLPCLMLLELR